MKHSTLLTVMVALAFSQTKPLEFPGWLTSYGGAKLDIQSASPTRTEGSYTSTAKPDLILSHYQKLFNAEGLSFQPSPDGIGMSLRAVKECALLISIRQSDEGTLTRIACTPSTTEPAAKPAAQPTPVAIPYGKPVSFSERDPHTKRVLEEAEARHREGVRSMSKFDTPVYPEKKKKAQSRKQKTQ